MKVLVIANQKGGVGKSTTAHALGAGLRAQGKRVLSIDLDAQCNLSYSMDAAGAALSSLEVLTGTATIEEAVQHTAQGDLIPASPALAAADSIITETGKEYRLAEALELVSDSYDFAIIDTPPALGILTVNALTAASGVIIPAQADIYSLQGIGQLSQTIATVRKYCNRGLQLLGMLVTRYNGRAVLTRDMTSMMDDAAKQLGTKLYDTKIRECIALKEAQASKRSIFEYAPKSNAAEDYTAFVNEVAKQLL